MLALAALSLVACEKHDFIDDQVITGEVGPQAYWEVGSAMAAAGSEMDFEAQYYTSVKGATIDRSEVWYNITETIDKAIICPWISSFTYSVTKVETNEKRAQQKIKTFMHDDVAEYSDSLRAYAFEGTFPISGTLSPFQWVKPTNFNKEDSLNVEAYFGDGFMQNFKDSLYQTLNTRDEVYHSYSDFKKMFLGLGIREDFDAFTDSTYDANTASYIMHFKWNADSTDMPIPADITRLYNDSINFAQLIQNTAENAYDVTYKRNYKIRAILRVYDNRGVYGTTVAKDIDIN